MNKCDCKIAWRIPKGLEVRTYYLKKHKHRKRENIGGRTISINYIKLRGLDQLKQKNSLSANFIHSLDASHVAIFISSWFEEKLLPIVLVHDCFGTSLEHFDMLGKKLRESFIDLYGADYIKTFHDNQLTLLKMYGIPVQTEYNPDSKAEFKYIEFKNSKNVIQKVYIPEIPVKGLLDINKVRLSKYMIY